MKKIRHIFAHTNTNAQKTVHIAQIQKRMRHTDALLCSPAFSPPSASFSPSILFLSLTGQNKKKAKKNH